MNAIDVKLLLPMPYDELMEFTASRSGYQSIIDDNSFWKLKLEQDYRPHYHYDPGSLKSAKQLYYEVYDLIREYKDNINKTFMKRLTKMETDSENIAEIYIL